MMCIRCCGLNAATGEAQSLHADFFFRACDAVGLVVRSRNVAFCASCLDVLKTACETVVGPVLRRKDTG